MCLVRCYPFPERVNHEKPMLDINFYNENGYCIVENIFSDEECAALIKTSEHLEDAKNGSFKPTMMPHRTQPIYLDAMKKPALVKAIAQLVGGTPVGLQTQYFFCKPGTPGFPNHQDNNFVQSGYGEFASAWVALTDTYPEKGGLIAYPGTHKEGMLPVRDREKAVLPGQDPNANAKETVVPETYNPLSAKVPKGAVFFIHGHLVHGSHANQTNEWRHVLLITYLKKGAAFRPGEYAQRAPVSLDVEAA